MGGMEGRSSKEADAIMLGVLGMLQDVMTMTQELCQSRLKPTERS